MRDATDFTLRNLRKVSNAQAIHGGIPNVKKTDIKSLPLPELEQWVLEQGEPKYRAK